MIAYIIRRICWSVPILVGVNLLLFALFFVVNTPDDMARLQLGTKRVTPEAVAKWKHDRGYDRPLFYNSAASGTRAFRETIFFTKSVRMFAFDFGLSDEGRDIAHEIARRMGPSLAVAAPVFAIGILVAITTALLLVFARGTAVDATGVAVCVVLMSISSLFYIIGGQFLVAKLWNWVPISGYLGGIDAARFVLLPVLIGVFVGIGSSAR